MSKKTANDKVLQMMDKFFEKSKNVMFYKDNNGNYVLFDKYTVQTLSNGIVQVTRYSDLSKYEFLKLKNAAVWCILDKYNKVVPANRVLELDRKISSTMVDKKIHMKVTKSQGLERKEIYRDKMLADDKKISLFQWELDKYIIMANECQRRGFENELKRIHSK